MSAQPRIIVTLIGSPDRVARVVVDTKARYQAIFSASGKLLDLDKGGIEYRRVGSCFRRFKASRMIRSAEWTVSLTEPGHPHYTTKVSGGNVLFNSSSDRVTVDARTYLLRRDITPADPRAGVPYQAASFSYPAAVAELKAPGVCS